MKGELSFVSLYATAFTIVNSTIGRVAVSRGKWQQEVTVQLRGVARLGKDLDGLSGENLWSPTGKICGTSLTSVG
mgnify:CR=1 FL=1